MYMLAQLFHLKALDSIRQDIAEHHIYVAVDETTDSVGRYMVHIIVGKLDGEAVWSPHLLLCRQLSSTNSSGIARLVDAAMQLLWPDGKHNERVLLLLPDAAPYMVKAGKDLTVFFPNMIHFTCIAHALHRVAEAIRLNSKLVNALVSSVRKIFLKAP